MIFEYFFHKIQRHNTCFSHGCLCSSLFESLQQGPNSAARSIARGISVQLAAHILFIHNATVPKLRKLFFLIIIIQNQAFIIYHCWSKRQHIPCTKHFLKHLVYLQRRPEKLSSDLLCICFP